MDLFTADNQGFTPLQRSIVGISYDTVSFLAKLTNPDNLPDPNLKEDDNSTFKIPSPSIRNILNNIKYTDKNLINRVLKWWT